ncbi:ribosome small subunit-dependent GTPase A [Arthrobacter crusticola]|uniref:Small ribosomal subunit biogenesis GTPase RsgA n=1 Tax=Arthrobacter crusticola TaxID=2547960 RepID=A0A4R5TXB1_9MICC|nr:ribosome small subunit-dependent GTPase A [Arthrobacter crusticola]TDK25815.1 ribosome small subunit-dependent GTPase A [Arthrobacter crusticola]
MATLEDYGYSDEVCRRFESHFHAPFPVPRPAVDPAPASVQVTEQQGLRPARVVRVDRRQLLVAEAGGLVSVPVTAAAAIGDWVALTGNPGQVDQVLPRTGVLQRKKAHEPLSQAQVVAANVEVALIAVPIDRPLSTNRLERTLVAARDSGARPLVVLTKADLTGVHDAVVGATVQQAGTAEVITTSALTGDGCEALAASLRPGETCVLIGPSGAGKSSLVNALVGEQVQDTGRVRAGDGRGRHTTTARTLIPLGDGVVLIDTPGLRGFALWDADEGLDAEFGDITDLAFGCRFRDCTHDGEPGCAVAAALADGSLDLRRFASYQRMATELTALHRRQDAARRRPSGHGRTAGSPR